MREYVEAPAEDEARPAGGLEGVQQVPGAGMDALWPGPALALGSGTGEGMQMGAFGVIETQGARERVRTSLDALGLRPCSRRV
ncbi:hypothetical protein NKH18_39550 [Streptomyces sp. M10(2022)]